MGFGILFTGYFLLINFAYFSFTDAISAIIMLYALYKLSEVNGGFKRAAVASAVFTLFGLFELVVGIIDLMSGFSGLGALTYWISILRHPMIAIISVLILMAIKEVAIEVGLKNLAKKSNKLCYATFLIFVLNIILETGELSQIIEIKYLVIASVLVIVLTIVILVLNMSAIFSAYQNICMPEDNTTDYTPAPSKYEFVNQFRKHQQERQQEYIDYKIDKMKKKAEKAKQKKLNNENKKRK